MGAERDGDYGTWGTAPYSGSLVASPTFFGHAHLAAYDKVGENWFLQKPNIRFQEDRLPLTPKLKTLGLEVGPARQWPTPYTHRQDHDVNTDIYLRPPVNGSVCTRKACTGSVCWIFSVLSLWASGWLWVPCLILMKQPLWWHDVSFVPPPSLHLTRALQSLNSYCDVHVGTQSLRTGDHVVSLFDSGDQWLFHGWLAAPQTSACFL